eukprot:CAMPEP_0118934142 /NCGR_PEP_ID=MMETSP1169-20130426/13660_1 /TAXON_ID=36882 /ORGANISM="Pyramimonas obovata, Strain CCMP722" /LENGTH=201 /DNA_ID=CAMNT_0006877013 /DNA_START=80 /DNA_END=685 /DNA_ORIENTATION=+
MSDEKHEFSAAALGTNKLKWLEACEYGVIDVVKELLEEDAELLNWQDNIDETGHSGLHKACLKAKLEVVKYLLEKGADTNLDDALLKTSLHIAAAAYKDDETGDFDFEDTIVALVGAGAMAFQDRDKKLPDAGEDAASKVDASLSEAERKGRAENAQRMKERKDRGLDAFGAALQKHLTNASTCVGVVGVKSFNEPGSTGK